MFAASTVIVPALPWVGLILALVIPLVTAIITKSTASSAMKGFVTVVLSAATAAGTAYVQAGGHLPLVDFVGAFLAVVLAAHVSYKVAWKPFGTPQAIQAALPGGIGAATGTTQPDDH